MNKYGTSELEKNSNIDSEIKDIFYCLINLANKFDVDLEASPQVVYKNIPAGFIKVALAQKAINRSGNHPHERAK
jgi:NTP pyrophosphatase (non-canonical NTP hydrolase)